MRPKFVLNETKGSLESETDATESDRNAAS